MGHSNETATHSYTERFAKTLLVLLFLCSIFSKAHAQPNAIDFSAEYDRVFQIRTISQGADAKSSIGSGFQVSADGLIVTNYHVVSDFITTPDLYRIEYAAQDGTTGVLELVDFDIISDLALLKHPNPKDVFFPLATNTPERGVMTYALGNPGDWGMVMVPGPANGYVEHSYEKRVLFSGSLNSGMSGGPSLNANGEIIGVNVATAGSQLSFLVPVDKVKALISRERKVTPDNFDAEIAKQIAAWQSPRIQELIDQPWGSEDFYGRKVFGEIRNDFQCWGGTNEDEPERSVNYARKYCKSGDDIYINYDVDSGQIEYGFYHRTPIKINSMQFARWQRMGMRADNDSNFQNSSNYECVSDFLDTDQTEQSNYTKVVTCIRAYKKYAGLYDSMVMLLNHHTAKSSKAFLSIAGAQKDQILALNRKFLESVQ